MSPARCFAKTLRECCTNLACAPFFLLAIAFYSVYYCWPYRAQLPDHISSVIVDEDQTPLSRRLARALEASPRISVAGTLTNRKEAIALMKAEKVVTIIGIPPDFERDALAGLPTALTLLSNGAFIVKARSSFAGASGPLAEAAAAAVAVQLAANGLSGEDIALAAMRAPALIVQPMYNDIAGYLNFVAPIVFMIILQTLMICGSGMLFYSWFRADAPILGAALGNRRVLLAVQAGIFCFCLFWAIAIEGPVFALQGVNSFQNVAATLCVSAALALAVSSLGLLVGLTIGATHYVIQCAVTSSLPAVFLSGNLWPMQNFPAYMRMISWFFPSAPGSTAMMRASQCGASVVEVAPSLLHLLALAALYFTLALLVAKWRKGKNASRAQAIPDDALAGSGGEAAIRPVDNPAKAI